jgi:hypothetical protein
VVRAAVPDGRFWYLAVAFVPHAGVLARATTPSPADSA